MRIYSWNHDRYWANCQRSWARFGETSSYFLLVSFAKTRIWKEEIKKENLEKRDRRWDARVLAPLFLFILQHLHFWDRENTRTQMKIVESKINIKKKKKKKEECFYVLLLLLYTSETVESQQRRNVSKRKWTLLCFLFCLTLSLPLV